MLPSGFPDFQFAKLFRIAPDTSEVRWALQPHSWPEFAEDLKFVIFRSQSPQGPWQDIATLNYGTFVFYDNDVMAAGTTRAYYYIVRIASKSGKGFRDSKPTRIEHDADHIAIELVRKKNVFLRVKGGVEMVVYLRKRNGPKCSRCYSRERNEALDEDCPDCYGTGYSGGYWNPVTVLGLYNPPQHILVEAGVTMEAGQTYFELANWPSVSLGDIIIDRRMNVRYSVDSMKPTSHRGHPISQIVQVTQFDESAVVYTLPLPDYPWSAAQKGRSYDFINRASPNNMDSTFRDVPARPNL